jgi:hypothetical protein
MEAKKGLFGFTVLAFVAIIAVAIFLVVVSGTITGAAVAKDFQIPNSNCYKFTLTRDNLVQNHAAEVCTVHSFETWNPCAETKMAATKYCADDKFMSRIVFENSDVKGLTHYKTYPMSYVLCADGRAKADVVKMPYVIGGIGYGLWYNNPNVDYSNSYTIQKCDTL